MGIKCFKGKALAMTKLKKQIFLGWFIKQQPHDSRSLPKK
jgi:hypothetical protein